MAAFNRIIIILIALLSVNATPVHVRTQTAQAVIASSFQQRRDDDVTHLQRRGWMDSIGWLGIIPATIPVTFIVLSIRAYVTTFSLFRQGRCHHQGRCHLQGRRHGQDPGFPSPMNRPFVFQHPSITRLNSRCFHQRTIHHRNPRKKVSKSIAPNMSRTQSPEPG